LTTERLSMFIPASDIISSSIAVENGHTRFPVPRHADLGHITADTVESCRKTAIAWCRWEMVLLWPLELLRPLELFQGCIAVRDRRLECEGADISERGFSADGTLV
jgi:hypothetical protein